MRDEGYGSFVLRNAPTCLEHDASKSGSDLPSRSSMSATSDFFLHGGPTYADSHIDRFPRKPIPT